MSSEPDQHRASLAELVRLFVDESNTQLTALAVQPPLEVSVRVQQYGASGWVDTDPEAVTNWFDATVAFHNSVLSGAMRFGDRESNLWMYVRRSGDENEYGLWEWAEAVGVEWAEFAGEAWLSQTDRLKSGVRRLASGFGSIYENIATADADLLARIADHRERRMQASIETDRARQQDRDEARAALEFREGRLLEAERLLAQHEKHLGPAQQLKLRIVRGKLRAGPT